MTGIGWTPDQFVLSGRVADGEVVSSLLASFRQSIDATFVLLVACNPNTTFGQLTTVSHADPLVQDDWRERLAASSFNPRRSGPGSAVYDLLSKPDELVELIRLTRPFRDISALAEEGAYSMPISTYTSRTEAFAEAVLLPSSDASRAPTRRQLARLRSVINASVPIVVAREDDSYGGILAAVRNLESPLDGDSEHLRMASAALIRRLLDIATDVTGSSAAAVYQTGATRGTVVESLRTGPLSCKSDEVPSIVRTAMDTGRTFVSNVSASRPLSLRAATLWRPPDEVDAAVAVPIPVTIEGGETRYTAALYAEKHAATGPTRFFSGSDVTLLRNASLRFAAHTAQERHERLAHWMSQVQGPQVRAYQGGRRGSSPERLAGIPADFAEVIDEVRPILEDLAEATQSRSATLRLLSTDKRSMIRAAAVADVESQPHPIRLAQFKESVVAWVGVRGRSCRIDNVDSKESFANYEDLKSTLLVRPGTKAELCVPIWLGTRFVGAVNLESRFRDAYRGLERVANAYIGAIATLLSAGPRIQDERIASVATVQQALSHALYGRAVDILDNPNDPDAAKQAADEILDLLLRADRRNDDTGTQHALVELVELVAKDHSVRKWLVISDKCPGLVVKREAEVPVRAALQEIVANAVSFMAPGLEPRIGVSIRFSDLAGKEFVEVTLRNPALPHIVAAVQGDVMFYAAIDSEEGRSHVGAVLAGRWMRGVGGDVFVSKADGYEMAVTLLLPIETTSASHA